MLPATVRCGRSPLHVVGWRGPACTSSGAPRRRLPQDRRADPPLLFGLLVQLDLDFVITSERLWGDHATVPSLAIYEALRDPSQRGIAQYEYRWDGRVLQGIG